MINGAGGTRADIGERLFLELLSADPHGPRFDPELVARADRFEQRASPNGDWASADWREFRLFAGQQLIAERRLSRVRGEPAQIEDTPIRI